MNLYDFPMAALTTVDWTKLTMPLILKRQNSMLLRVIRLSFIIKGISLFQEKPNIFTKPFNQAMYSTPWVSNETWVSKTDYSTYYSCAGTNQITATWALFVNASSSSLLQSLSFPLA